MPEINSRPGTRQIKIRYRGRFSQIGIYLGKLLRMFFYQNDWKVLPMSALIAGLVGLVIRPRFFYSMEGTLMSALAVTCVCLWNGCFNSILVICRERDVIKREHRSGMHISAYILSHMIYQALLCLVQTVITVVITVLVGVRYPSEGLITPLFLVDFAVSLFLITYAADMMSLWISALCRTTTTAMTIMPVVLIFQLIFSGGMMSLPQFVEPVTNVIISNYGLKLIASQADYNAQPLASAWNTVQSMRDNEITGTITGEQILEFLSDPDNQEVQEIRALEVMDAGPLPGKLTVGDLVDMLKADEDAQGFREQTITINTTPDKIIRLIGEDEVRDYVVEKSSATARDSDYEYNPWNVILYWGILVLFALFFASLAVITLEFIDKDKR